MDPSERPLPIITSAPTPQAYNQPTPAPAAPVSQTNLQSAGPGLPGPTSIPLGITQPERLPHVVDVRPFEEPLRSPDIFPRNQSQLQRESTTRRASPSSIEKIPDDADTFSYLHEIHPQTSPINNQGIGFGKPLHTTLAPGRIYDPALRRIRTLDRQFSAGPVSEIDHIVPTVNNHEKSVYDRLQPTLDAAEMERKKYERKAKFTGWALNAAIGLQVLLGSLTTGLSAVATSGRSAAVNTTILGALATITASYLARARGSNEPELSITRTKDLEQFIREVRAFQLDHGHETGKEYTAEVDRLRSRFEDLLGNANGERKLSPPV